MNDDEIKTADVMQIYYVRIRCPICCNREIVKYIPGQLRKCPECKQIYKLGEIIK